MFDDYIIYTLFLFLSKQEYFSFALVNTHFHSIFKQHCTFDYSDFARACHCNFKMSLAFFIQKSTEQFDQDYLTCACETQQEESALCLLDKTEWGFPELHCALQFDLMHLFQQMIRFEFAKECKYSLMKKAYAYKNEKAIALLKQEFVYCPFELAKLFARRLRH